jgi:hypothetical protein
VFWHVVPCSLLVAYPNLPWYQQHTSAECNVKTASIQTSRLIVHVTVFWPCKWVASCSSVNIHRCEKFKSRAVGLLYTKWKGFYALLARGIWSKSRSRIHVSPFARNF